MQRRFEYHKAAPGAMRAMVSLQKYVEESGLERSLLELVKTRASQINGCAAQDRQADYQGNQSYPPLAG